MLKAIIIDDEKRGITSLKWQLETYCADKIEIVALAHNGIEGIEMILKHQPNLIFLDIEMPKMNGFEMLQSLDEINFDVIFTTAYDQFAIKAFRFSAIDYLLKPIDDEDLQKAIDKVIEKQKAVSQEQLDILYERIGGKKIGKKNKIAIPTSSSLEFIEPENIIHCDSDGNYTHVHLKNAPKITVSKTLKEIESLLKDFDFFRIHQSHLINLDEIVKYNKSDGGSLTMSNNNELSVARSKKEELLNLFG